MNKFINLEEIEEIILSKENAEAIKNSDKYMKLQSELKEIKNNINSYPSDERAIYEARRDIIVAELNKIDDKYNFEKRKIEVKLNNIQSLLCQENEKINNRIEQLKHYKENLAISIKQQEKNLESEIRKEFSKRDTEKLLKYTRALNQFKDTSREINDELLKNIMTRNRNLQDLENLSYEKITAFSDEIKELRAQNQDKKTDERKLHEKTLNQEKQNESNLNKTDEEKQNESNLNKTDEEKLNERKSHKTKADEEKQDESNQSENKTDGDEIDEKKNNDSVEEEKKDVLFDLERAKKVKSILEEKIMTISNKKRAEHKATDEMEVIDYKYQDEKERRYNLEIDFYSRLNNIVNKYIEDEQFLKIITPNDKETLQNIEDVIVNRDSNLEKLLLKQKTSIEREYNNRGKKSLEELSKEGPIMKKGENETLPIEKKDSLWKRIGKKIPGIRRLFKEKVIVEDIEEQQEEKQQEKPSDEINQAYENWKQQYVELCKGEFLPEQFFKMLNQHIEQFKTMYEKSESADKKIYNEMYKKWKDVAKKYNDIDFCYKKLLTMSDKKTENTVESKEYTKCLEELKQLIHNTDAIGGIKEIHYCSESEYKQIAEKLKEFQKIKDIRKEQDYEQTSTLNQENSANTRDMDDK